jgi:uncharacterized cysteine cluster protein YcgN (CxxCxxCC family)
VPDCIQLDPKSIRALAWLPPTCAYRLVAEGRDLYWWHHLVSGDRATVHQAGISVAGRTVSESDWPLERMEERAVAWPGKRPRAKRPDGESSGERRRREQRARRGRRG